mgnify:CR=1 FL=1
MSYDMDTLIAAASNCLDAAERMLGDDDYSVKNARDAIKDYKSLKRQHLRYKACLDICRLIAVVYSACGGENADDITMPTSTMKAQSRSRRSCSADSLQST